MRQSPIIIQPNQESLMCHERADELLDLCITDPVPWWVNIEAAQEFFMQNGFGAHLIKLCVASPRVDVTKAQKWILKNLPFDDIVDFATRCPLVDVDDMIAGADARRQWALLTALTVATRPERCLELQRRITEIVDSDLCFEEGLGPRSACRFVSYIVSQVGSDYGDVDAAHRLVIEHGDRAAAAQLVVWFTKAGLPVDLDALDHILGDGPG